MMAAANVTSPNPGPSLALGTPAAAVKFYGASAPTRVGAKGGREFGSSSPHENRQPYLGLELYHRADRHLSRREASRKAREASMDPFLGQIAMLGCNFAPQGWALCQGQLLAIAQSTALFSLLGVNFGGNGVNNFALPDLRSRAPVGWGQGPGLSNYAIGEAGGVETAVISAASTTRRIRMRSLRRPARLPAMRQAV